MRSDGEHPRHLAEGTWPAWSPDGKEICFTVYPSGAERLALMPADGSERRFLTSGPLSPTPNSEAAWSPDGEKIAFVSGGNDEDIYVVNADGSGRKRLADDVPGNDHWPRRGPRTRRASPSPPTAHEGGTSTPRTPTALAS